MQTMDTLFLILSTTRHTHLSVSQHLRRFLSDEDWEALKKLRATFIMKAAHRGAGGHRRFQETT
jgi:hypothetical protein